MSKRETFIKNNIDVFTRLGKFPEKYKIQLKEKAEPKLAPYRRVPQTKQERFTIKLKELIETGVLSYIKESTN